MGKGPSSVRRSSGTTSGQPHSAGISRNASGKLAFGGSSATLPWRVSPPPSSCGCGSTTANFRRLRTALLPKDYIRFRLTGSLACEPSDAAATLLFDIRRSQWSAEMLAALDIEPAILPRIVGSGDVAGELSAEAAASCGLPAGVPVVGGAADNAAGAIGAGAVAPGNVVASIGTSGTVVAPTPRPLVDPRMRIHAMNHAVPDSWYLMGVVLSAGAALGWLRRSLSARRGCPAGVLRPSGGGGACARRVVRPHLSALPDRRTDATCRRRCQGRLLRAACRPRAWASGARRG